MEATYRIEPRPFPIVSSSHVSLLFSSGGNLHAIALREGQSLVVGRSVPAELVIDDSSLSRAHARLSLRNGSVTIQDLGSTNGCLLNGRPTEEATLKEEDMVHLGSVELRICARATPAHPPRERELSHAAFMRTLADELTRARVTGRNATVLAIRDAAGGAHEALHRALSGIDRCCAFRTDLALVMLAERDAAGARHWLQGLRGSDMGRLRIGLATYPGLAYAAEELVDRALHACHASAPGVVNEAPKTVISGAALAPIMRSPAMLRLYDLATKASRTTLPILIHGETGSGKELVAKAIHDKSPRSKATFKALNCATIPSNLLESVLFGHERGAFTGADRQALGVFEQAQGGTVLLDEVGELSPQAQAALLRVLEQRCVVRVGGAREVAVDARVVAATHRDLASMVRAGTFREDLMFRLDAFTLRVPPLRERREEIIPLAQLFMARAKEQWAASAVRLSEDVCEALEVYRWPGNVRQLKNVIERAVAVCNCEVIELEDLTTEVWAESGELSPPTARQPGESSPASPQASQEAVFRSLPMRVREFEISLIRAALDKSGGNQAQAARLLGVPRRTLASKMQVFSLLRSSSAEDSPS